jgi:hypothetical protein
MFGDSLFKMLDVLRGRDFSARRDFRFGSPEQPTASEANSRVPASASKPVSLPVLAPSSSGIRMRSVRRELRDLLDTWPGGRRMQTSLALIERALDRDRESGVEHVSPCVLAHAAVSLDLLDPSRMGPGLAELRRRLGLLLQERQGDDSVLSQESLVS